MPRSRAINTESMEMRGRPCHESTKIAVYINTVQTRNTTNEALGARSHSALNVRPHNASKKMWIKTCNTLAPGGGISGTKADRGLVFMRPFVLIMSKAVVAGVERSWSLRFKLLTA